MQHHAQGATLEACEDEDTDWDPFVAFADCERLKTIAPILTAAAFVPKRSLQNESGRSTTEALEKIEKKKSFYECGHIIADGPGGTRGLDETIMSGGHSNITCLGNGSTNPKSRRTKKASKCTPNSSQQNADSATNNI